MFKKRIIKEKLRNYKLNQEEKEEKITLLKKCNDYVDKKRNECSLINNLEILNRNKYKELDMIDGNIQDIVIQYGFDEKDIIEYDLENEINDISNAKESQEIKKSISEFFKKLLLYIGPIQCLIKAKDLSKNLFDLFEELKNRKEKEWISFKIQKF